MKREWVTERYAAGDWKAVEKRFTGTPVIENFDRFISALEAGRHFYELTHRPLLARLWSRLTGRHEHFYLQRYCGGGDISGDCNTETWWLLPDGRVQREHRDWDGPSHWDEPRDAEDVFKEYVERMAHWAVHVRLPQIIVRDLRVAARHAKKLQAESADEFRIRNIRTDNFVMAAVL